MLIINLEYIFLAGHRYFLVKNCMEMCRKLTFYLHTRLLHSSINDFWDRMPLARILNRLSGDYDTVNHHIPGMTEWTAHSVFGCMRNLSLLVFLGNPILLIFVVVFYKVASKLQGKLDAVLKRFGALESKLGGPIRQMYNEMLRGVTLIRIFNKEKESLNEYYEKLDQGRRKSFLEFSVHRWYNIRLKIFAMMITIPGQLLILLTMPKVGTVGMLLSTLLEVEDQINGLLWMVQCWSNCIDKWNNVEKYLDIPVEDGYTDYNDIVHRFESKTQESSVKLMETESIEIDKNNLDQQFKIKKGNVSFKNFSVKYRPDLPNALKNINIDIKGGEKLGIVGRTGAGKTTMIKTLYRSFGTYEGKIKIDGQDISKVGLKELRKNITVIPQDPSLFSETLRRNIDIKDQFSDQEIIDILKRFEIWNKFESDGLNFKIESEGKNLSQGEKQIICMARALLKKSKLVLLDEATASIDVITEKKIQNAVETLFGDATILIIAHRLNTIMFCDKILV